MKTPTSLYSRLALITSVTLVVGYFVVYAAYQTFQAEEYQSGASLSSTFLGKIVSNLDEINGRITTLEGAIAGASVWSKVGSDINYTAGKVGIGTTAPNKSLHLQTTTGTNAELDIQSGTKPLWGIYHDETTEELRFWNGDNRVVIGSAGNVGIGTISPGARLDTRIQTTQNIAGTVADSYPIASFLNESSASSGIRGLEIGAPTSGIISPVYLKVSGTSSRFALLNQSNVENFTVLENGNVGVGTASPGAKLQINSTTGESIRMQYNGNSGFARLSTDSANSLILDTVNLANSVVIKDITGNVGIGTSAPSMKLEVNGGSLMVKNHTTTNPSIYLDISPSIGVRIYATYNAACTTVSSLGQQIGSASSGRYLCWAPY